MTGAYGGSLVDGGVGAGRKTVVAAKSLRWDRERDREEQVGWR